MKISLKKYIENRWSEIPVNYRKLLNLDKKEVYYIWEMGVALDYYRKCFEHIKHKISRLRGLAKLHISPYDLGDGGEIEKLISEILELGDLK